MEEKYIKLMEKQNRIMRLIAVLMVLIFVVVVGAVAIMGPKLNKALDDTNTAVAKMETMVSELEEADLPGLINDTRKLVDQSNQGVGEAVEKIDALDIQSLNDAIAGLKAVVEPLSKLFGR